MSQVLLRLSSGEEFSGVNLDSLYDELWFVALTLRGALAAASKVDDARRLQVLSGGLPVAFDDRESLAVLAALARMRPIN